MLIYVVIFQDEAKVCGVSQTHGIYLTRLVFYKGPFGGKHMSMSMYLYLLYK